MENREYEGGRPFYGDAVGVLMLDMGAPLIPGNVGNAMSYNFPVRYKVLKGVPSDWWCDEIGPDESRCQIFIEAARERKDARRLPPVVDFLPFISRELLRQ